MGVRHRRAPERRTSVPAESKFQNWITLHPTAIHPPRRYVCYKHVQLETATWQRTSPLADNAAPRIGRRRWARTRGLVFCHHCLTASGPYEHPAIIDGVTRIRLQTVRPPRGRLSRIEFTPRRLTCPSRLVSPFLVVLRGCVTEVLIGALLKHRRISTSR